MGTADPLLVETTAGVMRVVDWYATRWWIEIYLRTCKQGCQVDRLQLQTVDRVTPALALYKIVSWRLPYVTMLGRECPTSLRNRFVERRLALLLLAHRHRPPRRPWANSSASWPGWVATWAANTTPPRPEVMWRGLRRVFDFSLA